MAKPLVAVFCMPEHGHFRQLRPLISGLAQSGCAVRVYTHARFGPDVERAGATLVDLFARHPLERADDESRPIPCRYVSYAAAYVDEVLRDLRQAGPALVVYETFSVIGWLAARLLGIPFVNVSAGHGFDPARYVPMFEADPRVAISERCHRAVEILRERYGVADASPFSYVTGLSPYLNICGEPPEFLTQEERKVFEPVAFFGSVLPPPPGERSDAAGTASFGDAPGRPRIYACFGTVVPKYYAEAALGVFRAVSECLARLPEARALISLGGAAFEAGALRGIARPNVTVVDYADQWRTLGEADLFITHHGVNSTHEAIYQRVPMLSYPFFTDQPALAGRCREFGLAIPLAGSLRGAVSAEQVRIGLERIAAQREALRASLERARGWELEAIAGRPAVLQKILSLV